MKGAEELSESSKVEVVAGGKTISQSIELMSSVAEDMTSLKDILNNLQTSSEKINEIIKLITGIAEQTNLLTLNAAIDESTKSISNIKGITDNLDGQAEQLQQIVSKFKT